MKKYKIAIIGGGPSGMAAAIAASQNFNKRNQENNANEVILIEKNDILGKKLLLTGNGRCNIANSKDIKEQLNLLKHKNFLKHSFYSFSNKNLLAIFKKKGLEFKEEGGRYFPVTDDANFILTILKEYLNDLNVSVQLNTTVESISKEYEETTERIAELEKKFILKTSQGSLISDKLIIATGGITYPQTGSNGEGYEIAKSLHHEISQIKPGLIQLKTNNSYLKDLSGISFENIKVSYKKHHIFGNVLITHTGLSGPGILDISNYIMEDIDFNTNIDLDIGKNNDTNIKDTKVKNISNLLNKIAISIDFIPNISNEELNKKIILDSQENGKTMIKNYLKYYLKNRFIAIFLNSIKVDGNKQLSNLNKKERNEIISKLKEYQIKVNNIPSAKIAMITIGGILTKDINPKTMESKIEKNLYFAGEIMEPYGPTGGYNLQISFSTGFLAGKSAAKSFKHNN